MAVINNGGGDDKQTAKAREGERSSSEAETCVMIDSFPEACWLARASSAIRGNAVLILLMTAWARGGAYSDGGGGGGGVEKGS